MNYYELIKEILKNKMGLVVVCDQEDFSIADYIIDSILFIQFILYVEEAIGKELPDDFLISENLFSAKGFSEKIDSFIND